MQKIREAIGKILCDCGIHWFRQLYYSNGVKWPARMCVRCKHIVREEFK